jgi:hypothetical protein
MPFVKDDGGRAAAGYKGSAGDCVCRSIAIASGKPYAEVYAALAGGAGSERKTRGRSARNGIHTTRRWFKELMRSWGFRWIPTMSIGSGCKVHLTAGELPAGRLVVAVSKHYTAVIDGTIHDTHNPERELHCIESDSGRELKPSEKRVPSGIASIRRRCVYGYWIFEG